MGRLTLNVLNPRPPCPTRFPTLKQFETSAMPKEAIAGGTVRWSPYPVITVQKWRRTFGLSRDF